MKTRDPPRRRRGAGSSPLRGGRYPGLRQGEARTGVSAAALGGERPLTSRGGGRHGGQSGRGRGTAQGPCARRAVLPGRVLGTHPAPLGQWLFTCGGRSPHETRASCACAANSHRRPGRRGVPLPCGVQPGQAVRNSNDWTFRLGDETVWKSKVDKGIFLLPKNDRKKNNEGRSRFQPREKENLGPPGGSVG